MLRILNVSIVFGIILSFSLGIVYYIKFKKTEVKQKKLKNKY